MDAPAPASVDAAALLRRLAALPSGQVEGAALTGALAVLRDGLGADAVVLAARWGASLVVTAAAGPLAPGSALPAAVGRTLAGDLLLDGLDARHPAIDAVPGAYLAVAIGGGVLEAIWRQPIAPGASCRDFFMVFRAWLIGHVPELREASGLVARGPTRAVLDAAPACLWTTRPDGACDFVNRTWLELTGTTFESQLGDGWVSSVHPEDRERTQIAYLRAVRARVPFRVEIRVRRADGSHGWLIAAGAPIFGGDGEFAGFIGSALDVDAWRQAARVSRRFFDLSPDILCVVGLDGRLRGVNTAFERTLGYAQDRLVGLGVHELLHPDDVPGALEILRHLAAAEQVSNFEVRMRARDGAFRWLQWNAVAVAEDAAIYAAARDVTERRDAVVALEHARAAAETATRTKSEFLARVSHEIRTPMNGVIGMTGLLLDTTLTGPQREYAETIRKSASALLTLINDILDFSKIEAGRLTIEPVPFDLALTLDEVTDLLAPRAIERGVEFIVHLAPDTPRHLIGDAGRIRQVLLNLADNALKFTEAGHVFINVSAVELGERPVRVRFAVHDTGIGIPSEVQAQLFEPFFQADTGLSRRHGGTGLGLAICRQLVHLMGGTIAVESSCGQGSTFTFTLPMEVDSTPRLESRQPSELAGLRALVVDDHRINRWMLREQLLALGMAPTICGGGEVALELMRRAAESEQPFRVALIDEEMPGMDGAELARTIGEEPAFAGTMLVMLVGHGRPPRRASADVIAYLSKPVRLVALRETLTSLRLEHADAPSPESARPSLHRRFRGRVLVVEDNAINQRVASLMLERLGCRVDVAADGREALDMVGQIPYDLIFMDCQMPEMDGFEATRAIRRGEAERRLPIAAMTAHALPDDRRRCIDAGMDEYLSKPVQLGELLRVVSRFIPEIEGGEPDSAESAAGGAGGGVDGAPALDEGTLAQLRLLVEDEGGLVVTLLAPFVASARQALSSMRALLAGGDLDALARAAHKLKGSSGTLGAHGVEAICTELMDRQRLGGAAQLRSRLGALEREIDRVEAHVKRLSGPDA